MKRNILIALAAALAFLAGCNFFYPPVAGSGFTTTTPYSLSAFTKISADQTFKVHVIPGSFSVAVTADDNLGSYLQVYLQGDTLILSLKPDYNYQNIILSAEVHMPTLLGFVLAGASQGRIDAGFTSSQPMGIQLSVASGAQFDSFACGSMIVGVSGASTLSMTGCAAADVNADASGASGVTVSGTSTSETLTAAGASTVDFLSCPTRQASVTLSGASTGKVNVSGTLTLSATGASVLYYTGSAPQIVELSGSSEIHQVN